MSSYELIINVHGEEIYETISIGGTQGLAAAVDHLDGLAKPELIHETLKVNVYDTVTIIDAQLAELLEHLKIETTLSIHGEQFDVYLSEV
jgi:maltooligosyltrehalose synthase